ncbi:hypothetical protein H0H92_003600 [Tricholoma furcatifolium]|nr:hypothetical protein H0H92_003600 [Tricholoma furcatifolium]
MDKAYVTAAFGCLVIFFVFKSWRIAPGFFANKLGIINMITVATGACAAVIYGMTGLNGVPSVVLIALFYGFFAGSFVGLTSPMIVTLSRDLSELGHTN